MSHCMSMCPGLCAHWWIASYYANFGPSESEEAYSPNEEGNSNFSVSFIESILDDSNFSQPQSLMFCRVCSSAGQWDV
jgi:hypothetical protein